MTDFGSLPAACAMQDPLELRLLRRLLGVPRSVVPVANIVGFQHGEMS